MVFPNKIILDLSYTPKNNLFVYGFYTIIISVLYRPLLYNLPLLIPNNRKHLIKTDKDILQYYSPWIFIINLHIIFFIKFIQKINELILIKNNNFQIGYIYIFYYDRLTYLQNSFLFKLQFILNQVFTIFSFLFIIFLSVEICFFYPLRYNKETSEIFNFGFLLISNIFIFISIISIFLVINKYCINNDNENEIRINNFLELNKFEPIPTYNNNFFCVICQQNYEEAIQISNTLKNYIKIPNCNHSFHYECFAEWIKIKEICPLCNQQLNLSTT